MVPAICNAIEAMSKAERIILSLRHVEELTFQEVGQVLGSDEQAAVDIYVNAMNQIASLISQLATSGYHRPKQ